MGFTLVQHKYAAGGPYTAGNGPPVTLASAPTVGNVICIGVFVYDPSNLPGATTVTDGNANAYTVTASSPSQSQITQAGAAFLAYSVSAPGTAHATITAKFTNAMSLGAISVSEFSFTGGTVSFRGDAAGSAGSGTTVNTPTVTAGSGDLVYGMAAVAHQVNGYGSFTNVGDVVSYGEGYAYILSAAGNTTMDLTVNTTGAWDSMLMCIQFTASGGAGLAIPVAMRQYRQRWS